MKSIVKLSIILGISNVFITPLYSSLASKDDVADELKRVRGALTAAREKSNQLAVLYADQLYLDHGPFRLKLHLSSEHPYAQKILR